MLQETSNIRRQYPFIIFTFIFLFVFFLDRVIQEGMFFDGITYASISRNMAEGKGSFWHPYYHNPEDFYDQPPLMFGLQSLFFRAFGDHYYTEKIYSFFTYLVTALLFIRLWRKIASEKDFQQSYWLPLVLWVTVPVVMWTYPNNMEESTMAIFDIAAVLALYGTVENKQYRYFKLLLAGLLIFCASLTKGPVGLFPLALPVIYAIAYNRKKFPLAVLHSVVLTIIISLIYFILWQYNDPRQILNTYINKQLFAALDGQRDVTASPLGHFGIMLDLLMQLSPAIILITIILIITRLLKLNTDTLPLRTKHILFFLLVGLSASLPIAISLKQRAYYLVPSFPFFITALALFAYPYIQALVSRYTVSPKAMPYVKSFYFIVPLIAIILVGTKLNTVGRDKDVIAEVKNLSIHIDEGQRIGICPRMLTEYDFIAYLERYRKVEVIQRYWERDSIIINMQTCANFSDTVMAKGYLKHDIGTEKFGLYVKADSIRANY